MTWQGTVSIAFPLCLRQPLIHPALAFLTARGTRGQCRGMEMFFPLQFLRWKPVTQKVFGSMENPGPVLNHCYLVQKGMHRSGKLFYESSLGAQCLESWSSGDGWIVLHPPSFILVVSALFWLDITSICLNMNCWCFLQNRSLQEPRISVLTRKVKMGSQSSLGGLTVISTKVWKLSRSCSQR